MKDKWITLKGKKKENENREKELLVNENLKIKW
jgi:hypothetical protein